MNIMQKRLLVFILAVFLPSFLTSATPQPPAAANPAAVLKNADSLFINKQYVQSRDLYLQLRSQNLYTPAMLLRLAFIEEGLGHLARSLYYLNLYYLATDDKETLAKLNELATKNNLQGYQTTDSRHFLHLLQTFRPYLVAALAAFTVLALASIEYLRRNSNRRPYAAGIALVILAVALFAVVNLPAFDEFIITSQPATYLMNSPGGSADIVARVGEGHRLEVTGSHDVWLKVNWAQSEAWVKRTDVLAVGL